MIARLLIAVERTPQHLRSFFVYAISMVMIRKLRRRIDHEKEII